MENRTIIQHIRQQLNDFPAVSLIGPRQSGKTTLAKLLNSNYFDLETERDRLRLDLQWDELISKKQLIVLDEAQTYPNIFPQIRSAIDADRKRVGRFLLLGSIAPVLMSGISESLAGRLSIVELSSFIREEIPRCSLNDHWLYGGFPDGGCLTGKGYPAWQKNYIRLLVERDLPEWGLPIKPSMTLRLLSMIGAVHGQQWNASQLGSSLGASHVSVTDYVAYLEAVFLVRRLQPYYVNIKKRLIKKPKIYWIDSGLLHAVHDVEDYDDLLKQPWVGASWEGFVIQQILDTLNARGQKVTPYYFRTSDGYELDLVFKFKKELWAMEIKLSANPSSDDVKRLNKTADFINADRRVLLSQTKNAVLQDKFASCDLNQFLSEIIK